MSGHAFLPNSLLTFWLPTLDELPECYAWVMRYFQQLSIAQYQEELTRGLLDSLGLQED